MTWWQVVLGILAGFYLLGFLTQIKEQQEATNSALEALRLRMIQEFEELHAGNGQIRDQIDELNPRHNSED